MKKAEISLDNWTPAFHTEAVIPKRLGVHTTLHIYEDDCQGIDQHLRSDEEVEEPLPGTRRSDELQEVEAE